MTTTRIIQLADGEEMISFETERVRPIVMDDPRRGALERRVAADAPVDRGALRDA